MAPFRAYGWQEMRILDFYRFVQDGPNWKSLGLFVGPEDNGRAVKVIVQATTPAGSATLERMAYSADPAWPAHQFRGYDPDPPKAVWLIFGPDWVVIPRFHGLMYRLWSEATGPRATVADVLRS